MAELHLLSPRGFRAGAVHAGIKTASRSPDVGLLVCDTFATAAAAFTTNKVVAAPIIVGRQNIARGKLRGIVVNAGNANACTGSRGLRDAEQMCALAARHVGCLAREMLPSSTGIIGQFLPMDKIERGIIRAASELTSSGENAMRFADAILTTDTKRKTAAAQFKVRGQKITIAGVCKGSGMIGPRMSTRPHATMLAYLTTDAMFKSSAGLSQMLQIATDRSFNAVTIDDHTSTNDTAVILASGRSGIALPAATFLDALSEVCESLAKQIAADGEGATKIVTIHVRGAQSDRDAKTIARAIANSPLVKCAMNGNDPNWGRIISAAGMCGVAYDPNRCELKLQNTRVFHQGTPLAFNAARLSRAMATTEVVVELSCGAGKHDATVWTCDLSKQYVTINADYHT
jgi:glutamate N-acetyltransferase/amino-acid N-acetyltransferase